MASPFEIFGIAPTFSLDERQLEDTYYALCKKLHPDRFATAPAQEKIKSQELSAQVNQAYTRLRKPEERLEALLEGAGVLKAEGEERDAGGKIPMEWAEEFFELQEAMEEDAGAGQAKAKDLLTRLQTKVASLTSEMQTLAEKMDWAKPSPKGLSRILELRKERAYLKSMAANVHKLGV